MHVMLQSAILLDQCGEISFENYFFSLESLRARRTISNFTTAVQAGEEESKSNDIRKMGARESTFEEREK